MENLIGTLKENPFEIFTHNPSLPLKSVKAYLDGVIELARKYEISTGPDIDEITIDGLDANQVWWQAKIVLDRVEGDLMERIQDLKAITETVEKQELSSEYTDASESEIDEEENDNEDDEGQEGTTGEALESSDESQQEDPVGESDAEVQYSSAEEYIDKTGSNVVGKQGADHAVDLTALEGVNEDQSDLNDEFFNLEEFNKQTLNAEADEEDDDQGDEEAIDFFGEVPSDDEEEAIYYEDFFDKPNSKKSATKQGEKVKDIKSAEDFNEADYAEAVDSAKLDLFADEGEDFGLEDNEKSSKAKLSTFEKQQSEIQKQIEQLEKDAVAEKKWALKGEVGVQDRPVDSLLTEDVEFDRTAKPVPVITEEVSESLEQLIRRRIQEYNFDDLQRRIVSNLNLRKLKPQFELSDQKSSKSLAEIYEDDYKNVPQDATISEELQKSHDEISELFTSLCYKLDALSSAHFIPKPAQKSLEIRVDSAAISMEDAQPLSMSSAAALAPQEIYKVGKSDNANEIRLKSGTTMSRDELTREDKNRLRRAAKRKRSKHAKPEASKKSKKDNVIDTLAKSKNITVINQKGEKHDVRGRAKSLKRLDDSGARIKL